MAKTQDFSHNFPGTTIDRNIFTVGGAPKVNSNIASLNEKDSLVVINKYDLSNSYIFHKVEIEPGIIFVWSLDRDSANKVGFIKRENDLTVRTIVGNVVTDFTVPYNPVAHKWWRIRESLGTLYFETGPDGINWNVLHTTPTPFTVISMTIHYKTQPIAGWGFDAWGIAPWGGS